MPVSPFTHRRVKHSEQFVRDNLKESITPIKNNVENVLDVDITTDLGKVDVQYTTSDTLYVDFISVLNHIDPCVVTGNLRDSIKFWAQVDQMNKDIKVFQGLGYSIPQIYHCLGAYASKDIRPGKFMNEKYDYVAYVKYVPKTFDVEYCTVLDLKYLREVSDKRTVIAFNRKDKWNSKYDLYHSAYIKFPQYIIEEATVTDLFMV